LRKASKIKAFTIFLAWLVIFAHSIIPHNHVSDNFEGCQELIHEISSSNDNCDGHLEFENLPEETSVCHLSGLLFQQFNQDNIFISTEREDHYYPVILIGSVKVIKSELFLLRPYYGSSSLRAPPAA
jgi:hypothetical protein